MNNTEINRLRKKLEELEEKIEGLEFAALTERVYNLEEEIQILMRESDGDEFDSVQDFNKKIQRIKKDNDFYDPEAELDRMFPNRYDDDFDEDSMSYDSVFGGD